MYHHNVSNVCTLQKVPDKERNKLSVALPVLGEALCGEVFKFSKSYSLSRKFFIFLIFNLFIDSMLEGFSILLFFIGSLLRGLILFPFVEKFFSHSLLTLCGEVLFFIDSLCQMCRCSQGATKLLA